MKYFSYLICFLALICCSKTSGDEAETTEKTAADFQTIENTEPEYDGQFWSFSTEPELVIGSEEDEKYQFYRAYDAIQLPDGDIMISNSGTHEVRIYDENGNYLKSFGRQGKGPGEFGEWSSMHIYRLDPDSVGINDSNNSRINIFSVDGNLGRTVIVEPIEDAGNPQIVDLFSNGSWLVWSTVGPAALRGKPGSLIEKDYGFYRLNPDNTYSSRIFSIPARTRYVNEANGSRNFPFVPLSPDPQYLTDSKNGVLYSAGKKAEVTRFNSDGYRTRKFIWDIPRQEVSEIWDRYTEHVLSTFSREDRRLQYEHFYNQDLPLPEKTPSIEDLKIDRLGFIWVKRYTLPWQDESNWDVLSPSGNWLGTLRLPQGVNITEIGKDYLLGYTRNDDGVRQFVKYNLIRETKI